MKKVIYISFSRLTDRISRDWYIDYLIEKGVSVEYWDIVSLVREEHNDAGMKSPNYLHIIQSFNELEVLLTFPENRDALYIMLISCGGRFTRLFRLLSRYNCRMLYITEGARPVLTRPITWKIIDHLSHPLRLIKIIYNMAKVYTYKKFKLIKPFNVIFAVGDIGIRNDQFAYKVVPINLCDYDHYIRVMSSSERIVKGRYAVFLDVNLPFHNDHKIMGLTSVNADTYYQSMNRFFDLVEAFHNIKVVIAAHPTSDYGIDTYAGREIYRLRTAEMVKDADFVISMHSTSTSYAVLNRKPIIFVYTNEMSSLYKETFMRDIRAFSYYLEAPIYNVDEITEGKQIVIKDVDQNCYDCYKYSFMTSRESEHATTQKILFRELDSLSKQV